MFDDDLDWNCTLRHYLSGGRNIEAIPGTESI